LASKTVNLVKLGKKLRREARANPKKAVFLGVAALVAVYFWMPLVWGWIGKSDPKMATPDVSAGATSTVAAAPPAGESAAKPSVPERPNWQQIIRWMHDDPRTMTAPPLMTTRDPFEPPKIEVAETKPVEPPKPKPSAIAPTAAGLVLTSTIIGPQRRVAQINGKTYAVGQTVEALKQKEAVGAAFRLVEVQSRRAVLEADGQRFELSIPEPGKSGKIEFLGAVGSGQ
jgi:hypothetical protein